MEETGVPGIYYNTYQGCTRYVKYGLFLPKFLIAGQGYGVQHHFQQQFSDIVAVCFVVGGNRGIRRKRVTDKLYHIMLYSQALGYTL
jgi:hypothetical protein